MSEGITASSESVWWDDYDEDVDGQIFSIFRSRDVAYNEKYSQSEFLC